MLIAALALALAQAASVDVTAGTGLIPGRSAPSGTSLSYTSDGGVDLGCLGGIAGSKFPSKIYDQVHNEWIVYNVSRCTGGYIHAMNQATGRSWRVSIGPGGALNGGDLRGEKWRFDKARHVFVNLSTHTECGRPDYRDMCPG